MTDTETPPAVEVDPTTPHAPSALVAWVPTLGLIRTRILEIRRRIGLMIAVFFFTIGLPLLVLGIREIFHLADPHSYGPAGSPGVFQGLSAPLYEFGFIIAAAVGATAGTSDLTDGVFRHLVISGRSRLALYFARIPAGLAILVPLAAAGFALLCAVTAFLGTAPSTIGVDGVTNIPAHMSQAGLKSYLLSNSNRLQTILSQVTTKIPPNFGPKTGPGTSSIAIIRHKGKTIVPVTVTHRQLVRALKHELPVLYRDYTTAETSALNPTNSSMIKIGLYIELWVLLGFLVGLGLGSLIGQRTVTSIVIIVHEIIVGPILANVTIPHFIDVQRSDLAVALLQLEPSGLIHVGVGRSNNGGGEHHGPGKILGSLGIPPMPNWAMITVIVAWAVVFTGVGAWRMARRDA